jgi:hypothetical protein
MLHAPAKNGSGPDVVPPATTIGVDENATANVTADVTDETEYAPTVAIDDTVPLCTNSPAADLLPSTFAPLGRPCTAALAAM